ncbi:MbnP family copper-binding protein [Polyangium fumosum]|uniref:Metallo-mystery pair system four-Cys motif protein n=1 Tax=Polyangium fumosum TaxID=889272 RepID=A0A4U1J2N9_9BACT|nr:MbnP family copper-binding protein [Polyangium fumosum]TKD01360.1 metallo-mystery pair system four-Cys motif protein [Polyangium fumosum]
MNRLPIRRATLGVISLVALTACGGDADESPQTVALQFAAKVGDEPFACATTFEGLGTTKSTANPLDFRMYVHDVRLVRADGAEVPLALEQDERWQRDNIAFLDFEDGTATCTTGSPETRTEIVGDVAPGEYVGVAFDVGLPPELNHLDAATAPAPLNIPGMWWSWKGGYKFVRLELRTTANPTYFFHLGSTSCEGTVKDGFSCAASNHAKIRLDGFDPTSKTIVFDVASFYAGSDLDLQIDPMTDSISGCMSFSGDPECPPVFEALGLPFEGQASGSGKQTAFRVE